MNVLARDFLIEHQLSPVALQIAALISKDFGELGPLIRTQRGDALEAMSQCGVRRPINDVEATFPLGYFIWRMPIFRPGYFIRILQRHGFDEGEILEMDHPVIVAPSKSQAWFAMRERVRSVYDDEHGGRLTVTIDHQIVDTERQGAIVFSTGATWRHADCGVYTK